jgi:hypothetical protein
MGGPPICHAFIMVEKIFDIPAMIFYLASIANKNKREEDLKFYYFVAGKKLRITIMNCH